MIDKTIFYCWFGKGKMTELNKRCLHSWKVLCPDYRLEQINENNFDYTISDYAIEGYEKGNWSAVSNTARLEILKKESGFYLDTDVQLFKSLDILRELDGGFITEFDSGEPDSGVLGCGKGFPKLYEIAQNELIKGSVLHKNFIRNIYQMYDIHGEDWITYDDGFSVLGEAYFPTSRFSLYTKDTIGVHFFENSWVNNPINITDPFYPYQRVNVFFGGRKIFDDKKATVDVEVINANKKWRGPEILGRLNYFFNPKVVKIQTRDFVATRIGYKFDKEVSTQVTASGMIVTYIK